MNDKNFGIFRTVTLANPESMCYYFPATKKTIIEKEGLP